MSNFIQRVFLGFLIGLLLFANIYFSYLDFVQPFFVALAGIFISSSLWEYYKISKMTGGKPLEAIGILGSFVFLYALFFASFHPFLSDLPFIILILVLFTAFISYFFSGKSPFVNLAITMFGVVYLTVPLSLFIPINFVFGRIWMLYLLLVTKLTDIGAYFIGKQWGKHPLAPIISPKKTWEGALGGFLLGTFASYLMHKIAFSYGEKLFDSSLQSILFGGVMSVVAQLGDLSESLLKRDSGTKDSNRLPGFGGVLDMIDSLVFTTPLLYFFLKLK